MKGDTEAVAERLQVAGVGLVVYIFHANVKCFYGEVGNMDTRATGEELQEAKGVLATRQTDEDAVTLVDELVLSQRLVECLPESFLECHGLFLLLWHSNMLNYFMKTR